MSTPYAGRRRNAGHPNGRAPGVRPPHAGRSARVPQRPSGIAGRRGPRSRGRWPLLSWRRRAGYQANDRHQTGQAGYTVSAEAIDQANELSDTQIENDAELASARNDANASAAAAQEKIRRDQLAAEAAAAKARQEAAERAAREKERIALAKKRDSIIARAKSDPKSVARVMLPDYGWDDGQFSCLDNLWEGESGWNYLAENPSSGPTASRSPCPAPRWPRWPPTGARTPSPRSRGGCATSKAPTAARATRGRSGRAGPHWY